MSQENLLSRTLERLDEHANPILVKEVQQGLRNRALLVTALLSLIIPLLFYVGLLLAHDSEEVSEAFFILVICTMGMASILMVPMSASRMLVGEITSRTLELITLTRLTAWQNMSGRFQGSLVKTCFIVSLLAPFAVSAVTMGTVSAESALLSIVLVFGLGVMGSAFALLLASLGMLTPRLTNVSNLVYLLFCFQAAMGVIFVAVEPPRASSSNWGILLWLFVLAAVITVFFLRLGADLLVMVEPRTYARSKLVFLSLALVYVVPIALQDVLLGGHLNRGDRTGSIVFGMLVAGLMSGLYAAAKEEPARFSGQWPYPFQNRHEANLCFSGTLTGIFALGAWNSDFSAVVLYWGSAYWLFSAATFFLSRLFSNKPPSPQSYILIFLSLVVVNSLVTVAYYASSRFGSPSHPGPLAVFLPIVVGEKWAQLAFPKMLMIALPFLALFLTLAARKVERLRAPQTEPPNTGTE